MKRQEQQNRRFHRKHLPSVGMATSVATLASVYYGEKDRDSLRQLYKTSLIFCELFTVVRLLILIPFAKQLSILFGATGEVINYTIDVSILYALAMPINIPCIGFMNIHQTLGKVTNCNIIYVVSVLFVNLFCARVLSGQLGVTGIWIGYILQESSNLLLIYIIAAIRKKKLILSLDDVLFYDDDINVGTHITISINNIEDAINLSKQIEDYCISENVDSRRAKLAGLCIEEMTVNIIEIGFPKSKSINKNIDIYCDVDDESKDVNIRIKDNTVAFDPYVKVNEADKSDNIGVRIVSRIAKEMSYQVNFGLNVLSITL